MNFITNVLPIGADDEHPFDYEHGFIFDIEYIDENREVQIKTVEHRSEMSLSWGSLRRIGLDEFNSIANAIGTGEIIGLEEVPNEICLMIFKKEIK